LQCNVEGQAAQFMVTRGNSAPLKPVRRIGKTSVISRLNPSVIGPTGMACRLLEFRRPTQGAGMPESSITSIRQRMS
jgi:hypothetical protein